MAASLSESLGTLYAVLLADVCQQIIQMGILKKRLFRSTRCLDIVHLHRHHQAACWGGAMLPVPVLLQCMNACHVWGASTMHVMVRVTL